jgi:predicted MFS family arabinose efflux permease
MDSYPGTQHGIRRGLVWLFGLAAGLSVANIYYIQPLLDVVARDFDVSAAAAGLLVTLTQLGFVIGLLLLVPLGDMMNRGSLATAMLLVAAAAFAVAGMAPTFGILAAAIGVIGVTSVVAQILVPLAATLADDAERGQVVGSVMTGVMLGTLLSRTLSGGVAGVAGWRSMCWIAAALMLGLAALLRRELPNLASGRAVRYRQLFRSVVDLVLHETVVQRRAAYGALSFAVFSAYWTAIAFLLARDPYGFSETAIGAVALIGIPAAFLAPQAGRWTDGGRGNVLTGASLAVMLAGAGFAFLGRGHLGALLVGGLLISVGSGCLHVANQSLIYRLNPEARSRLTTVYMTSLFAGGMGGSALAAMLYATSGWKAVALLGAALTTVGLMGWLVGRVVERHRVPLPERPKALRPVSVSVVELERGARPGVPSASKPCAPR